MTPQFKIENVTIENVTIYRGKEPGASGTSISISGGTHTHKHYGPVPSQEEGLCLDDVQDLQIEQPEEPPAKTDKVIVRSCRKRLSELRQQICTFDGTQTPDAEFWQALYDSYQALESDLDGVLK